MDIFSYCSLTRYLFGAGTENQTGMEAAAIGMKNVLIVYGGGSAVRSGLLGRVKKSLEEAGIKCYELGVVEPNPTDGPVRKGIEICRENNIDGVIAVGGGSVIDTAKAIALGDPYSGDFWDFFVGKETLIRTSTQWFASCMNLKATPSAVISNLPSKNTHADG